jgi:hypothetical protein
MRPATTSVRQECHAAASEATIKETVITVAGTTCSKTVMAARDFIDEALSTAAPMRKQTSSNCQHQRNSFQLEHLNLPHKSDAFKGKFGAIQHIAGNKWLIEQPRWFKTATQLPSGAYFTPGAMSWNYS